MKTQSSQRFAVASSLVLLATVLLVPTAGAQEYSEWAAPVNLGPVVNSNFDEQHMGISKDGRSLYFGSNRPGGCGGIDIWVSGRESTSEPWGEPQNLGCTVNSSADDFGSNLAGNDHFMYFNSNRNVPGACGLLDLYVTRRRNKRDDSGWQTPVNLGCQINTSTRESGASFFEDDETGEITLYFNAQPNALGLPGGTGLLDVYVSTLGPDETFGPGVPVSELNTPFGDTRTAIRQDGLEIFFASTRPGGSGGFDLYTSTRASTTDPWSEPVNLGPVINSSAADEAPSLSFHGTELYFFSTRGGGFGLRDLYVITRTKLTGPQP